MAANMLIVPSCICGGCSYQGSLTRQAVKAELCGEVFSARFKKFFEQHGRIQVKQWYQSLVQASMRAMASKFFFSPTGLEKDLDGNSPWQQGPMFLSLPADEWPMKSAKDVLTTARETVGQMQKKTFAAALTRAQVKKKPPDLELQRPPAIAAVRNLVDKGWFTNLTHLVEIARFGGQQNSW